jgi:hypothetical protein
MNASEATDQFLVDADQIATAHVDDGRGMCAGCLAQWSRFAPAPCEQALWAERVRTQETVASTALTETGDREHAGIVLHQVEPGKNDNAA